MNKQTKTFSADAYETFIEMKESGYDDKEIISELGLNINEYSELKKNFYEDM